MARSHPRFEHITNEQCNKIRPLLKISADDVLDGILNPYQKLRKLDKGVLNLGPEYLIDDEVKEWLTRGHVSVHEKEWHHGTTFLEYIRDLWLSAKKLELVEFVGALKKFEAAIQHTFARIY
ncbi:hypothetical protein Tco_0124954 [Tanacetum coccineum]